MSSFSSAPDTPTLTSNTWAPAATWFWASRCTRLMSPASRAAANFLRPVGFMRSPIMTTGWSWPMITSWLGLLITVCICFAFTLRGL